MRFIKPVSLITILILLATGCSTLEKSYQKTRKAMTNLVNAAEDTYRPTLGLDNDVDLQFAKLSIAYVQH